MRVVILGPLPPMRGGIAAHTQGMTTALRACGHDVRVISYRRLFPRWIAGSRPGSGSQPSATGDDAIVDCLAPRTWLRAAAHVRALDPDVLIAQYWTPIAAAAIRVVLSRIGRGKRIIVCHNVVPHERFPGALAAVRWLLRGCDGVLFHSRYVREQALALGCRVPTLVARIPLLVGGGETVGRPPPELSTARAQGARLFVCAGHVRKYKGLGILAAAWRRAAPSTDCVLVVAGESLAAGSEARTLGRMGAQVLVIPRYLDDEEFSWLLSNAEAVLLPYVAASQSGVLPAALRLARNVIVSNAGGLAEETGTCLHGSSVSVVAAGDVDALATAIAAIDRRATAAAALHVNGALRYEVGPISARERDASWAFFVSAVGNLARAAGGAPASNRHGSGPSELCGRADPTVSLPRRHGSMPGARQGGCDAGRD